MWIEMCEDKSYEVPNTQRIGNRNPAEGLRQSQVNSRVLFCSSIHIVVETDRRAKTYCPVEASLSQQIDIFDNPILTDNIVIERHRTGIKAKTVIFDCETFEPVGDLKQASVKQHNCKETSLQVPQVFLEGPKSIKHLRKRNV